MEKKQYSFSRFLFIWSGQFLSVLGSAIFNFGLAVWLFEKTGAATPFALSFLCSILPSLLLSPLAGSLADRTSRKRTIILTDTIDALLKVLMVVLLFGDNLKVWMIYPGMTISATLSTFQSPAFSASIPMLVKEEHLSKANGLRQLSGAAQNMLAPIFAGILYPILHLKGLIILDLCSYIFAFVTIALTKIPQPKIERAEKDKKALVSVAIRDFKSAIKHLYAIPKLFRLLMVFAVANFIMNMSTILLTPMILSNYDSTILGFSQTISGVSMIVGAIIASILPNPKRPYALMYGMLGASGIGLLIGGTSPKYWVIFVGIFIFCLFVPYVNSLSDTILQMKFEKSMLGRITSAVGVLCQIAMPLSALFAGVLADYIFNPLMMPGGALAKSFIGDLIGVGDCRGIGLIYIINGIVLLLLCTILCVASLKDKEETITHSC